MLNVEMQPAEHGDALFIEYGSPGGATSRMIIDGGPGFTYDGLEKRILRLKESERHFELLVITHVDDDHIGGVLKLVHEPPRGTTFGDIWFNGYRHLPDATGRTRRPHLLPGDILGPEQGEQLTTRIVHGKYEWNKAFGGNAVMLPDDFSMFPSHALPGGLRLTVLTPTFRQLAKMRPVWSKEVKRAKLVGTTVDDVIEALAEADLDEPKDVLGTDSGPLEPEDVPVLAARKSAADQSAANGTTISLLAEFGDASCILAGDAHAPMLAKSLVALARRRGASKLEVDAFKLPHHGARGNISSTLLSAVTSRQFLFSSSGRKHHHPHREAVARVLTHGGTANARPTLYFNYSSDETRVWDDDTLKDEFEYHTALAASKRPGLAVSIGE